MCRTGQDVGVNRYLTIKYYSFFQWLSFTELLTVIPLNIIFLGYLYYIGDTTV